MKFPENFCDIGDKDFNWVFQNRQKFVQHTMNDMRKPTGLFKIWFEYCRDRMKKTVENNKEK